MSKKSFSIEIEICLEKDDDGYHAFCPAFQGLHVGGKTQKEAIENAKDAITSLVFSYFKRKKPLPVGILKEKKCEEICPRNSKMMTTIVDIPSRAPAMA